MWMENAGVIRHVSDAPALKAMQRGGIVGRARIVDVLPPHRPEALYPDGVDRRWHMRDQFGFVLADVEPLPFVPCKGMLGLFDVPEDVVNIDA